MGLAENVGGARARPVDKSENFCHYFFILAQEAEAGLPAGILQNHCLLYFFEWAGRIVFVFKYSFAEGASENSTFCKLLFPASDNVCLMKDYTMKKVSVLLVVILALMVTVFGLGFAQAAKKIAGVHRVHSGESLEAKVKTLKMPYYMDAHHDPVDGSDTFLVLPANAGCKMEVFAVEMSDDAQLHLGAKQTEITVANAGEGFVLRHLVSEGIPNLAICFMGEDRQRECWIPRYSGVDGSLVLDEGFYPVREKGEDESEKTYSHATEPLLTGPELVDQPYILVARLKDAKHLAKLAAENRLEPKGEFKKEMPHHFFFVPLVEPATIGLYVLKYRGGDGFMDPDPVAEVVLKDSSAAVFSLDLDSLTDPDNPDENPAYIFVLTDHATGGRYHWGPQINHDTGALEGYGLGPVEKFIHWPN